MGGGKIDNVRQGQVAMDGWKPYTLSAPILIAFTVISLCLAGVIEFFAQKSERNGGLALSASADDIPRSVTIAYLYLPTTISVIYSIAWTWIDLDIRRIQPWLELSRREGATAEASILVDYPFEFLAFVPFKAWKRKHWPVFYGGLIMMVIFWAITPLQTAVFGIQAVVLNRSTSMQTKEGLLPLEEQATAISESILNDAYGVTWLGQDYPEYTTPEYAVLPFSPADAGSLAPNETWTGNTTKLTTDLTCWPASVNKSESFGTFDFDNGRGCKAQGSMSHANTLNSSYIHGVQYVGYHHSTFLDWYLQGPSCSQNSSHQFLAIYYGFDNTARQFENLTALFCETSYRKQDVSITITADAKLPDDASLHPLGDETSLLESEFNSTALEYLIGTGVSPVLMPRDYPDDIVLHQFSQFFDQDLSWPLTPMVGFALGGLNLELGELSKPDVLKDVFAMAHRKIFSVAMGRLVSSETKDDGILGDVQYTLYAILVSRPISAIVEGLLVFVASLTGLALLSCQRKKCHLSKDPASMGSMFKILNRSYSVLDSFAAKDSFDSATLAESLSGQRYGLVRRQSDSGDEDICLEVLDDPVANRIDMPRGTQFSTVRPKELRYWMGLILILTLVAVIAILAVLKAKEMALGGLPRPSENFEVLQILENYIPTIFATLLEPFLIVLNRLLCILQPFHDLQRGKAEKQKMFETTYTNTPPQFTIWRALRSRHFLLAAACTVSLLANILAVALGGLFNELPVSVVSPISLQQSQMAALGRTSIIDSAIPDTYSGHFYVVMANISNGTRLPPWTTPKFVLLPFGASVPSSDNSSLIFRGRTRGFGVEPSCRTLSASQNMSSFVNYSLFDNGTQAVSVVYKDINGTNQTCVPALTGSQFLEYNSPAGKSAYELFTALLPAKEAQGSRMIRPNDAGFCERKMLVSWMRTDTTESSGAVRARHIECSPAFRTGLFDVNVDASGYVLDATLVGGFDNVTTINTTEIDTLLTEANGIISDISGLMPTSVLMGLNSFGWHNDTLTRDWMNYLLKVYTNSAAFVDPTKDVPDSNIIVPIVEDVYRRLFSTLLGLELSIFKQQSEPVLFEGTVTTPDTRIFMDETAFIISIAILGLNIIFASILYFRERNFYLPRMPSTIASIIAYVAASRAVREYDMVEADQGSNRNQRTRTTYSFGRYIGVDGRSHVGIEIDPLVVPLDQRPTTGSDRISSDTWFRRRNPVKIKQEGWI